MDAQVLVQQLRLEQWKRQIEECAASGKSVKAWCKENSMNCKTYYYRLKRIRESACKGMLTCQQMDKKGITAAKPAFAELKLPESRKVGELAVTVQFGNAVIEIRNGADPIIIENTLRVLKSI